MTLEFTPLTVLIGGNGCGKSTILQALDFLCSLASMDIGVYLKDRGWKFEDLKSQIDKGPYRPMEFISFYEFQINNRPVKLRWTILIDREDGHYEIEEYIVNLDTGSLLLSQGDSLSGPIVAGERGAYAGSSSAVAHDEPDYFGLLNKIQLESSGLKIVRDTPVNDQSELRILKLFLVCSNNFGLISPDKIRGFVDNNGDTIGQEGKNLAAFIHSLPVESKKDLDKIVSGFTGIKTQVKTRKKDNTIELYSSEIFESASTEINSGHISDGMLRLIAFGALSVQNKSKLKNGYEKKLKQFGFNGIISLDEIENGISPYLSEKVAGLLQNIVKVSTRQIIVTTHSPVVLNDFDPKDIVFLWRDRAGVIYNKPLFALDELKDMLDFVYPGDAWMNIRQEDLLKKMGELGDSVK
jgi:predicted ATPase